MRHPSLGRSESSFGSFSRRNSYKSSRRDAGYNRSRYDQQSHGQPEFNQPGYKQPDYNQPQPFPDSMSGNVPGGSQKCPKCGRNVHSNLMFCGKFGHFRRCCRLAQNEWRLQPHGDTDRHCGANSHGKNSDLDARQYIVIQIKDRTLQCLIDTGSVRSVISRNSTKQLRLKILPLDSPGLTMPSTFVVVEGLCPNLLLGTDFLSNKS